MRSIDTPRFRVYVGTALILTSAVGALLSCSDSTTPNPTHDLSGTYFGPEEEIGGGTARSYATLDGLGAPTEIGLAFTEAALTALPAGSAEYVFALPSQASLTPFKHAVINWEPLGHPPAGVYTVPHFDFHFYMITSEARDAIILTDPAVAAKIAIKPSADFFPAGYIAGMASARMGQHWRDPSGPEFNGQPFTGTIIYGSYDGAINFVEPMVAKSYLESKPLSVVTPLKLPATFGVRGYQPTSYTVRWDAGTKEYRVSLSDLVLR